MEITYNIKAVYIYDDEGETKACYFSRKVSRRIWEYALSTSDFRSFLKEKSRECSDTISRMGQTLQDVTVTFHISFQDDTPFVESAVCFFKTVSGGELRCRYDQSIQFEELLSAGKYFQDRFIEDMILAEHPKNSSFYLLVFGGIPSFSALGIMTAQLILYLLNLKPFPLMPVIIATIALMILAVCLRYINRRRFTRRMEIQDEKQETIK